MTGGLLAAAAAAAEPVPGGSGVFDRGRGGERVPTQTGTSRVRCFEQGPRGYWGTPEPRWPQSPFLELLFGKG